MFSVLTTFQPGTDVPLDQTTALALTRELSTGASSEDVIDPCEAVTCPDNSVRVNGSTCVCTSCVHT